MKSIKALFVVTVLGVSGLAMAEGGAERTLVRMDQVRQASMEAQRLAQQRQDAAPVASDRGERAPHANC